MDCKKTLFKKERTENFRIQFTETDIFGNKHPKTCENEICLQDPKLLFRTEEETISSFSRIRDFSTKIKVVFGS